MRHTSVKIYAKFRFKKANGHDMIHICSKSIEKPFLITNHL